ncbi:DUF1992 domain-containing protein [Agromyces neolithicus]|uniref:DnaJ homologue subfamily C member 28 conserved domain-containing protein n=1 Tax=Agromyces neolithicus TaxID=269420 RepID=A0ABP4Y6Q0_9MICO
MGDPRDGAAQYRLERLRREARAGGEDPDAVGRDETDASAAASVASSGRTPTAADRAAYVETVIEQAIRRGDFDDLPGAGKPLQLGATHDPDWWIRRKIQTEQLTGLGPPALALRVEHAEMQARLDALTREADVREHLEEFNSRVVEARRQLLGGPPVVTPTRDVDAEVAAWRERRAARQRADAEARAAEIPTTGRARRGTRRRPRS